MDQITGWVERNWFELASLVIQCVILATVAWYGRKTLRFVRAFYQYQDIFRQKLGVSIEAKAGDNRGIAARWHDLIRWLQEPMRSGRDDPFRRVIRWLQAPMGS